MAWFSIDCWKVSGEVDIVPLSHGRFILRLSSEKDKHSVRTGGPWVTNGAVTRLRGWRPNFKLFYISHFLFLHWKYAVFIIHFVKFQVHICDNGENEMNGSKSYCSWEFVVNSAYFVCSLWLLNEIYIYKLSHPPYMWYWRPNRFTSLHLSSFTEDKYNRYAYVSLDIWQHYER